MTDAELLVELEGLPLLGRGQARAVALCRTLAERVALSGDAETERRLLARGAEIALVSQASDAVEQLVEVGRLSHGVEALRVGLLTSRALAAARRLDAARELLATIEARARDLPALAADRHLAAAACGTEDVRAHLEEALRRLPSPARDHDRLHACLALAEILQEGGDLVRARERLAEAEALARRHGDAVATCHVGALLGNLLVEAGLPGEAREQLMRCVDQARALDDALTLYAEGTVLVALLLAREAWSEARSLARELRVAAIRRGNWLGVADAVISESTCALALEDLAAAVAVLTDGVFTVQPGGNLAAVNVIKARLGELRVSAGRDSFDPLFRAAVDARRA